MNLTFNFLLLSSSFLRRASGLSCVVMCMLLPVVRAAPEAVPAGSLTNSLSMVFRAVDSAGPLFSVWETRVVDFEAYLEAANGEWERPSFKQDDTHPAVNVSWGDASSFCRWLTKREQEDGLLPEGARYRLPSSAEWDRAVGLPLMDDDPLKALAVGGGDYPWGKEWPPPPNSGNYHPSLRVESFEATAPVGSFPANRFGLHDLGGNVWEWCSDPFNNSLDFRVLRGASWRMQAPSDLLSEFKVGNVMSLYLDSYGFRPVLELPGDRAEAVKQVNRVLAAKTEENRQVMARAEAAEKAEAERIAREAEVEAERQAREVADVLAKYQDEGVEPGARRKRSWLGGLFRKEDKSLSNKALLNLDGTNKSSEQSPSKAAISGETSPVEAATAELEGRLPGKKSLFSRIFSRKKDVGEAELAPLTESQAEVSVEEGRVEGAVPKKRSWLSRVFRGKKKAEGDRPPAVAPANP